MDLYDMREDEYLSYDQIIEMDVELDYLVDTLIRDKCVSVLSALPKMGKTSFAISLAYAIANGTEFLGLKTKQRNVLYICLDDCKEVIAERCKKMKLGEESNLSFQFTKNARVSNLEALIIKHAMWGRRFGFVIIDMLNDIREVDSGMEYNFNEMKKDIQTVRKVCDDFNLSILLLHHNKKRKEENFVNDLNGSTALAGTINGSILSLNKTSPLADNAILHVSGRNVPSSELNLKFNKERILYELQEEMVEELPQDIVKVINYITRKKQYRDTVQQLTNKLGITTNPRIIGRQLRTFRSELMKNGIELTEGKSNGKRIIELKIIEEFL